MLIGSGWVLKDKRLMIQIDGASDNVNDTMLKFCAWLCQQKIARTVRNHRGYHGMDGKFVW